MDDVEIVLTVTRLRGDGWADVEPEVSMKGVELA